MKTRSSPQCAFSNPRILLGFALCSIGLLLALRGSGLFAAAEEPQASQENSGIQFG